jgi:HAT1-interacting factor 1
LAVLTGALTENFPQAVQDYTSSLEIRKALLPGSSRALAYVHYQLGNVLELTPGRRDDALSHVEQALAGFKARLAELNAAASGASASNGGADVKGKGKATGVSEEVAKLNDKEREGEKKDVEELIGDLEMKIEELKTAPPASDLISDSINHLLGQGQAAFGGSESTSAFGSASESAPVNDLTGMVKKKKKVVPAATEPAQADGAEKRKGEDGEDAASKKARTA